MPTDDHQNWLNKNKICKIIIKGFAMSLGNKNKIKKRLNIQFFPKIFKDQNLKHEATNGNFATQQKYGM